jgi:hypothetical protein
MAIYRARIRATKTEMGYRKGQHVGYKTFDAKSLEDAKKKKRTLVGPGRKVTSIEKTNLKGTTASRSKIPRSRRFGRGYI